MRIAAIGLGMAFAHGPAVLAQGEGGFVLLPKQLAAPADDILSGRLRLPDPASLISESRWVEYPVLLTPDGAGGLSWEGAIPVDDASRVRIALVQPDAGPAGAKLEWSVIAPQATGAAIERRSIAAARVDRAQVEAADGPIDAEVRTFVGGSRGSWTLRAGAPRGAAGAIPTEGRLIVATDSPHTLRTNLSTLRLVTGEPIGIVASFHADTGTPQVPIAWANYVLTGPDRVGMVNPMYDDGAHGDGAANDGVFGASFTTSVPGPYEVSVTAGGPTPGGVSVLRSARERMRIVPGGVTLLPERGAFALGVADAGAPGTVAIAIPAACADPTRRCFVGAEVWGIDPASGASKPAVWTGMMTEPQVGPAGDGMVALHLDARWLATSAVGAPFELRNVRVQDPDTFALLDERDVVPLALDARLELPAAAPRGVEQTMLVGRPRPDLALAPTIPARVIDEARATTRAYGAHNLMLVHGWCAGGSPWPSADFAGYTEVFSDPDANRSHDEFAQLIFALGNSSKSYGVVAHSQGGCAALHLWTFYFSGLDWATGPRLIQSVGSPYQGTPLASLGFFSCGTNDDMTPTGAAAWLANIPSAQRDAVYYYTTSPSSGNCNFFTNLVLGSPNDGVTEVARDQLPGAHNMGNTLGWCHTTGMNQPAQYTDHTRNAEMNANAAR